MKSPPNALTVKLGPTHFIQVDCRIKSTSEKRRMELSSGCVCWNISDGYLFKFFLCNDYNPVHLETNA